MSDVEKLKGRVREYLLNRIPTAKDSFWNDICTVYLFGSAVRGGGWKKEKDLDLAVYFHPSGTFAIEDGEKIGEELERAVRVKVDVVTLNYAPPLMRYEVIKNGEMLYCSDEEKRVDFEVKSLLEFYELEPLRRRLSDEIRQMIRDEVF
ncbi:MAG TPA: nucleotidyltransferase domain-containing protein [Candidatus Latescibacteria bacterium]|nr:nucleotidyltransferase domain-containing protein [Candidatus Latescibacterota bacterium]